MKLIFVLLCTTLIYFSCDTPAPPGEHQPSQTISSFKPGDHCVLRNGLKNIVVATTKEELDKLLAMDDEGIAIEVAKDRSFLVKAEVPVTVGECSYTVSQVRIEQGPNKYRSGWVPNEFIKSN
jgi:hypothetical protein